MAMAEDEREEDLEAGRMPLLAHLTELRNRLMWSLLTVIAAFLVCYQFKQRIYDFLAHPLFVILGNEPGHKMIYTGLTEAFFTYIKVSFRAAICISFPVIAILLWKFVAPGMPETDNVGFEPSEAPQEMHEAPAPDVDTEPLPPKP